MTLNLDACPKLKELGIADNAQQKGVDECLECEFPVCYHDLSFKERCQIGLKAWKMRKAAAV
jgi:hypothetical protein